MSFIYFCLFGSFANVNILLTIGDAMSSNEMFYISNVVTLTNNNNKVETMISKLQKKKTGKSHT